MPNPFTHIATKTCSKCLRDLPASEFYVRRRTCKACFGRLCWEHQKKMRGTPRAKQMRRAWLLRNRDRLNVEQRIRHAARRAERRAANADRIKNGRAARVAARLARKPEQNRAWHQQNRAARLIYLKKWRENNAARRKAYDGRRRALVVDSGPVSVAVVEVYERAQRDDPINCYLCGQQIPVGSRQVEHVIPLCKGGLHVASNLNISCPVCNLKKGRKLPAELGIIMPAGAQYGQVA